MKLGKYNVTFGNIKAYVQGNIRYYAEHYGPAFAKLDEHLKEQIAFRELVANPACKSNSECKCHCPIPELFYADKTCEDSCYPIMMDATQWKKFKGSYNGLLDKVTYPFDWQSILLNGELATRRDVIKLEDSTYDAGVVDKGDVIEHSFVLDIAGECKWIVEHVTSSCYCTTSTYTQVDDKITLLVKVDTKDKNPGKKETTVVFNYTVCDEPKLIFLVIKFEVK